MSDATASETIPYPSRAPASANAFENVRSTATFSTAGSIAAVFPPNSTYASSTTTSAPDAASCSTTSTGWAFPVGLFGEQTKIRWGSAATACSTCWSVRTNGGSTGTCTTAVWVLHATREYTG
jgi:hypothetical protein